MLDALKFWDIKREVVFMENAGFFEMWQGGLSHSELMAMTPYERGLYFEYAKQFSKRRAQKPNTGAQVDGGGEGNDW